MGENNYELGSGQMYLNDAEFNKIGVCTEEDIDNLQELFENMMRAISFEFGIPMSTFTGNATAAAYALERITLAIDAETQRLKDTCSNRRVVHLAFHAKKRRIRDKNTKRMIEIVNEQEKLYNA